MTDAKELLQYSQGFVYSRQSELDSLENPENYTADITEAEKRNQADIARYGAVVAEPIRSNTRAGWARRNQAKKALAQARQFTKEISTVKKEIKEQVTKRKIELLQQRASEQAEYVEKVKEQERKRKELEAKQKWLTNHNIWDIPKGIELGYLGQGAMTWYNQARALENRPGRGYPTREINRLQFMYKGGNQKQWDAIIDRENRNRAAAKRQSASIKGAAAIVESGGILGGKYTGTGYDESTGQLTGDSSANNWGGYGSKEAQQRALQQELAKSFQAHPTYFNKPTIKSGFSTGNQYFKDGKVIDPKSDEGKKLQETLTRQAVTKEVNVKQSKLFWEQRKAQDAAEAWGIREEHKAADPRVGTFNYLMKGGKITETSGTIGIATKTEVVRENDKLYFQSEYDPSVVPVDPGFKGVVDTTPQSSQMVTYDTPQYDTPQYDQNVGWFPKGVESTGKFLDQLQKDTAPKNVQEGLVQAFVPYPILIGMAKEGVAVGASIINLATQHVDPFMRQIGLGGLVSSYNIKTGKWEESKDQRPIEVSQTAMGTGIEGAFAGQSAEQLIAGQAEYMKKYGVVSTVGEYLTAYPGRAVLKLLPFRLKDVASPGISTSAKVLTFGYGDKSRILVSSVDGTLQRGVPKVQGKIEITPTTARQLQRGVAGGGDAPIEMQKILAETKNIEKIEGITPLAVERAKLVQEIVQAGSKADEVLLSKKPMEQAFESVRPGTEQESLFKSLEAQQKGLFKEKLGAYEGSLSEQFFTDTTKYQRPAGDYDFNVKDFEFAAKAAQRTADDFVGDSDRAINVSGLQGKGIYFVGVTDSRAAQILKEGFDVKAAGEQTYKHLLKTTGDESYAVSRTAEISPPGTLFFTPNPKRALQFAIDAAKASGEKPVLLRTELKEGVNIKRIQKFDPKKHEFIQDVAQAKKEGYQGILKPMGGVGSNLELVMFSGDTMKAPTKIGAMQAIIKEEQKSAKNVIEGKKVGEFLNPQEVDEKGVAQAFSGSAYMGKEVPKKTFQTDVGKTKGLQVQLLKRGSSLYSFQKDSVTGAVELAPAPFRFEKDVAMFYRTAEQIKSNLLAQGKTAEAEKIDLKKFRDLYEQDGKFIDEELQTAAPEPVSFTSTPSAAQSIADSEVVKAVPKGTPSFSSGNEGELMQLGSTSPGSAVKGTAVRQLDISPGTSPASRSLTSPGSPRSSALTSKSQGSSPFTTSPSSTFTAKSPGSPFTAKSSAADSPFTTSPASPSSPGTSPASPGFTFRIPESPVTKSVASQGDESNIVFSKEKTAVGIIVSSQRTEKPKPKPKKPRKDFRGNVPVEKIVGVGKKKDIVYGSKKAKKFGSKLEKLASSKKSTGALGLSGKKSNTKWM